MIPNEFKEFRLRWYQLHPVPSPRQLTQPYLYLSFYSLCLSFMDVPGRGLAYIKVAQAELILKEANFKHFLTPLLQRKGTYT
jgi:hypothetical protein